MNARWTLLAIALLVPGCTISCEHELEPATIAPRSSVWPRAHLELPPATPATEIVVRHDGAEVRNEDLIATWPAEALARAREASDQRDWPKVAEVIGREDRSALGAPAVQAALARTRRAERSATGAGSGASAFNLRVESAAPFDWVERVLYAAAQAGYGSPRVLLDADGDQRMLAWPSAAPRGGPSRAQIEAALRGAPLEPPASAGGRFRLTNAAITAMTGDAPICTEEDPRDPRNLEPCIAALATAAGLERVTLEVAPDTRFDRVAGALQALVEAFEEVSVVGAAQR